MLISRVACLAKLSHKPIGFTGPLSRSLLCFHSFIDTVRESLHDMVEMVLANMLLNGDIGRDRQDWTELGLKYVSIIHPSSTPCGGLDATMTIPADLLLFHPSSTKTTIHR